MKKTSIIATLFLLILSICAWQAAQGSSGPLAEGSFSQAPSAQYAPSMPLSCVRTFNDQAEYGWYALQNVCSQEMTVAFVGKNGSGAVWGSMDLQPGQSQSTGESPSEIDAVGGIYFYPCPYHYIPTDPSSGQAILKPAQQFVCKYRGY